MTRNESIPPPVGPEPDGSGVAMRGREGDRVEGESEGEGGGD